MSAKANSANAERERKEREREMRERQAERREEEKRRRKELEDRLKAEQEEAREKAKRQRENEKESKRAEKEKEKERKKAEHEKEMEKKKEQYELMRLTRPAEEQDLNYQKKQPVYREPKPFKYLCRTPGVQLVPKKARKTDAAIVFEDFAEFIKPLRKYMGAPLFNSLLAAIGIFVFLLFVILMQC